MSRPTTIIPGTTVHWVLRVYDPANTGVLIDADSLPSVGVRKNGVATGDSVTVSKRALSTGVYDCSVLVASTSEGDSIAFEESLTISLQVYEQSWNAVVIGASADTATAVEAALLNDGDGQQFLNAINSIVEQLFDAGVDVPVATLVNLVATEVMSRIETAHGTGSYVNTEDRSLLLSTTVSTVTSQTAFKLTDGAPQDDAYNGLLVVFTDSVTSDEHSVVWCSDYDSDMQEIFLESAPLFTVQAGDFVKVLAVPKQASSLTAESIKTVLAASPILPVNATQINGQSVTLDDLGEFYIGGFTPVKNKELRLVRGDTYSDTYGNAIAFVDTSFPDLSSLGNDGCKLTIKNMTTGALVVDHVDSLSVDNATKTVKFELSSAQTDLDPAQVYKYDMEAHFGSDVVTLSRGLCDITDNIEADA